MPALKVRWRPANRSEIYAPTVLPFRCTRILDETAILPHFRRRAWTQWNEKHHDGTMTTGRRLIDRALADKLPLLVGAAGVVGIAIAMDGSGRRALNGVGGTLWLVAAVVITRATWSAGASRKQILAIVTVILVLSSLIRPSDSLLALIGFGAGGAFLGLAGRNLGSKLGATLGALWFPAHIVIALMRAGIRELRDQPAAVRNGPPPTAALVPLIMVLAAWGFAYAAQEWQRDRSGISSQRRTV
jgi:hypothetical protein